MAIDTTFGAEFIDTTEVAVCGGRQYVLVNGTWYLVTETDRWGRPVAW